jgi:hypothetical protein
VRQNIAGKGVTGKILKRKGMAAAGTGLPLFYFLFLFYVAAHSESDIFLWPEVVERIGVLGFGKDISVDKFCTGARSERR